MQSPRKHRTFSQVKLDQLSHSVTIARMFASNASSPEIIEMAQQSIIKKEDALLTALRIHSEETGIPFNKLKAEYLHV